MTSEQAAPQKDKTDVLILGGGSAGLAAAAIALRQKGIECLVVKALGPAIETLSSHPDYFQQLLSVHVGAESLRRFAVRQGIR
ncbi:MAG: FAD-dependent monooxygenase, partial [Acidobacteriaceae bacterium]